MTDPLRGQHWSEHICKWSKICLNDWEGRCGHGQTLKYLRKSRSQTLRKKINVYQSLETSLILHRMGSVYIAKLWHTYSHFQWDTWEGQHLDKPEIAVEMKKHVVGHIDTITMHKPKRRDDKLSAPKMREIEFVQVRIDNMGTWKVQQNIQNKEGLDSHTCTYA